MNNVLVRTRLILSITLLGTVCINCSQARRVEPSFLGQTFEQGQSAPLVAVDCLQW